MRKRNGHDRSRLPVELLRPTPRHVRPNAMGTLVLIAAAVLVVAGLLAGLELHRRSKESNRRVALFMSEARAARAEVVRIQRRNEGNDRRSTVHYRYRAAGQEHMGSTAVRREDRDRYAAGAEVPIRYLASQPGASWLEGYAPQPRASWPAFVAPIGSAIAALALVFLIRRQTHLLAYGRPALAVVTKVEKKRGEHGTIWRVHYEWAVLSGATRKGRYDHGSKNPPSVGTPMPIVYDMDTERSMRYPPSLVRL